MLYNCVNFNSNINVNQRAIGRHTNCTYMFSGCFKFNQFPVYVGGNCAYLFGSYNASKSSEYEFNSYLYVNDITNGYYMLRNMSNFKSSVIFYGNSICENFASAFMDSGVKGLNFFDASRRYTEGGAVGDVTKFKNAETMLFNIYLQHGFEFETSFSDLNNNEITDEIIYSRANQISKNFFSEAVSCRWMFFGCTTTGFRLGYAAKDVSTSRPLPTFNVVLPNYNVDCTMMFKNSGFTYTSGIYSYPVNFYVDIVNQQTSINKMFSDALYNNLTLVYNYEDPVKVSDVVTDYVTTQSITWDINSESGGLRTRRNNRYNFTWYKYN